MSDEMLSAERVVLADRVKQLGHYALKIPESFR